MLFSRLSFFFIIIFMGIFTSCTSLDASNNISPKNILNEISLNSNYDDFNDFNMIKDNVTFKVDSNYLNLKFPIYLDKNRYYICLNEFVNQLNGKIIKTNDSLNISLNNIDYSINLLDNTIHSKLNDFSLKKSLINQNNIYYIGFSDFSHMLNMHTRWDKNKKIINCKTNDLSTTTIIPYKSKIDQIGLIRLEDIGISCQSYDDGYFEKLRIIADYMYQKKIPYHIAWIPRYVIPNYGVDNDPISNNSFEIAEMVYTLDYFNFHNGIIGLHGYTHQCGTSESGAGFEFGRFEPSITVFEEKIKKAMETASYLDIPISFFEAPHYEITPAQNKIAEKYFKILYYPFNDCGPKNADLTKPQLSPYNKSSYYISTPLDYIPEGREEFALNKLKNSDTANMGSIFFHPSLENNYISLTEDSNGAPTYTYSENSTLKKLIDILEEKGFRMIKATDLIQLTVNN